MRLFFALWPDEPAAEKLAGLAAELAVLAGGKPVARQKIHLTLAFLGDVEEYALATAMQAPVGLEAAPFDVVLDQVGSFRGARVAWAGCGVPSPGLAGLQAGLAQRLHALGFVIEERPYTPHVTVARKVTRAIGRRPAEPIAWRATEFALVRSELGKGSYTTLAGWKLR